MTTDKYKVIAIFSTSENKLLLEDDLVYIDKVDSAQIVNLWKAEDPSDRTYLGGINGTIFTECLEPTP